MLRQMNHKEKLLDWLNKEKQKDQAELMREKERFTQQLIQMKKTDLFFTTCFSGSNLSNRPY